MVIFYLLSGCSNYMHAPWYRRIIDRGTKEAESQATSESHLLQQEISLHTELENQHNQLASEKNNLKQMLDAETLRIKSLNNRLINLHNQKRSQP